MLAMLRSMQFLMIVAGAAIECLKGYLALQQIKCSSLETMQDSCGSLNLPESHLLAFPTHGEAVLKLHGPRKLCLCPSGIT